MVEKVLPVNVSTFWLECPGCKTVRSVGRPAAMAYLREPRACRVCARKKFDHTFASEVCRECWLIYRGKSCPRCSPSARGPRLRPCEVCGKEFVGARTNSSTCSVNCQSRRRRDKSYFAGQRSTAAGYAEKKCQVCSRDVPKGGHVHHVLGHPDTHEHGSHDHLVLLCPGCHDIISKLAMRKDWGEKEFEWLVFYVLCQRSSRLDYTVNVWIREGDSAKWVDDVARMWMSVRGNRAMEAIYMERFQSMSKADRLAVNARFSALAREANSS